MPSIAAELRPSESLPSSLGQTDDNIPGIFPTRGYGNLGAPDEYEDPYTLINNLTAMMACGAIGCAITFGVCCICVAYVARSCISSIPAASVTLIKHH